MQLQRQLLCHSNSMHTITVGNKTALRESANKIFTQLQHHINIQYYLYTLCKKLRDRGWRGGLVVKSTGFTSRAPGCGSQHPHDSSQQSLAPVPRDLKTSSDLLGHQRCTWYTDMHAVRTLIHTNKSLKSWKIFRIIFWQQTM